MDGDFWRYSVSDIVNMQRSEEHMQKSPPALSMLSAKNTPVVCYCYHRTFTSLMTLNCTLW